MGGDGISNMNGDATEDSEAAAFATRPSSMPKIGIDLSGFATEELATKVGEAVYCYLYEIGKILNLTRLVEVIVSYDYQGALARLERGVATSKPLTATSDEIAVGIAMAPTILREGEPRAAIVLNAAYMIVFAQPETPDLMPVRDEMVYTLTHECAHVHDLEMRARCLPGIILNTTLDFRDGVLFWIASGCWEEYIACRLSAFMGTESTLGAHEDTFCSSLDGAKNRADATIRQYRMHADVRRVTEEVSEEYRRVMIYAAYLIGHLDGRGWTPDEHAPKAMEAIERNDYFKPFFAALQSELRAMYADYGEWKSLDVFEPLKLMAERLLKLGGLDMQPADDGGARFSVPFRSETIPTLSEQLAYLAAKKSG
jgi:hypothetical protein